VRQPPHRQRIVNVVAAAAEADEFVFAAARGGDADGIFDEQREELDIDVKNIVKTLPALISVRTYDKARNFVVRSVLVK
jgi:hypothetical protein